jgi:beta-fructofuranosidase
MWECPDFFSLGDRHCLLYSTEGKVFWTTGHYDPQSHRYTPELTGILDHGAYYAPKSFLVPDGRRILWGWIQETRPQAEYARAGWSGAMAFPRVLTVAPGGHLEISTAEEVKGLREKPALLRLELGHPYRLRLVSLRHELFIPVDFSSGSITVRLRTGETPDWELAIDLDAGVLRTGDLSIALPAFPWHRPGLQLFLDGSVIECFVGGREAITCRTYSIRPGETEFELTVTGAPRALEVSHWSLTAISSDRLTT